MQGPHLLSRQSLSPHFEPKGRLLRPKDSQHPKQASRLRAQQRAIQRILRSFLNSNIVNFKSDDAGRLPFLVPSFFLP